MARRKIVRGVYTVRALRECKFELDIKVEADGELDALEKAEAILGDVDFNDGNKSWGEPELQYVSDVPDVAPIEGPPRKFFKTILEVEILSEEPLGPMSLTNYAYEIAQGDCSGVYKVVSEEELDGPSAAKALIEQGSDPEFFALNEDGSDMTWD